MASRKGRTKCVQRIPEYDGVSDEQSDERLMEICYKGMKEVSNNSIFEHTQISHNILVHELNQPTFFFKAKGPFGGRDLRNYCF